MSDTDDAAAKLRALGWLVEKPVASDALLAIPENHIFFDPNMHLLFPMEYSNWLRLTGRGA